LLALEKSLVKRLAKHPKRPLLASHPVYHYLARRYDLNLQSVTWEPNVFPDPSQWQLFSRLRQAHSSNVMLWEAKPLAKTQEQLSAQNVSVVVFDPCANRPTTGDFLSVMQQNIKNLDTVLAGQWP
jgi:zinc transport system substrate-binding protein